MNLGQSKIQCQYESKTRVSSSRKQCRQARLPNQLLPKSDKEDRCWYNARIRPTGNSPRTKRVKRLKEPLEKGSVRTRKRGGGFASWPTHALRTRIFWYGPAGRPAIRERASLKALAVKLSTKCELRLILFHRGWNIIGMEYFSAAHRETKYKQHENKQIRVGWFKRRPHIFRASRE